MHQAILFRLSNLIPVDMNDMESDLALVGWTSESLYFSCWKDEPIIHINREREYCWYCNSKFRSLKFSAPGCRFISLWNFKGVTGLAVVLIRVQLNDIFVYKGDIRPINVKTTKTISVSGHRETIGKRIPKMISNIYWCNYWHLHQNFPFQ